MTVGTYVVDPGGCWVWLGRLGKDGYGRVGRSALAHRAVYELHRGPVPAGMTLDHLCRNTACVNPDHLEAVTNRENVLRSEGPSALLARRDRCHRGHLFTPANTYRRPAAPSVRCCRTCHRMNEAQARRSRGIAPARRLDGEQLVRAQKLRTQGLTFRAIGEALGFNHAVVLRALRREGQVSA